MLKPTAPLSNNQLEEALAHGALLSCGGATVRLFNRRLNPYASRSPTEIASFVGPDGQTRDVLVKYEDEAIEESEKDHRGGTRLECLVYERVLDPLNIRPEYFASGIDPTTGRTWLIVEYISDALNLGEAPQPQSLRAAARWLGKFHSAQVIKLNGQKLDFLTQYKSDYFATCVSRTIQFAGDTLRHYPWFPQACARSEDAFRILTDAPQTIVHGEYYAKNILWRDGAIFPVDWETAAIAPGEIDVASLIEGWPAGLAAEALETYCTSRGITLNDKEFQRRLVAADIYWAFRWLGYRPDWTIDPGARTSFDMLAAAIRRFENLVDV